MRDGDKGVPAFRQKGLGVGEGVGSGGGIPVVSDGKMTRQPVQYTFAGEHIGHVPHCGVAKHVFTVAGNDAAALLTPVLQGMQAQRGEFRRISIPVNAEDAAKVFDTLVHRPSCRGFAG